MAGSPQVLGKAGSTLLFFPYFFPTVLHREEKKPLVISIQFLCFVCWSQLQLRGTSNMYLLSVMFESSRATGYWNTAYSRDLPSPCPPPLGKWGKKTDLEHNPSVGLNLQDGSPGRPCAWLVLSLLPIYWVWHFAFLGIKWVECFFCHSLTQMHISLCCIIYHGSTVVWLK